MSNRKWPMTVKGDTGGRGVSYNDLLRENHRLQAEIKQQREMADGLVDEVERERFRSADLERLLRHAREIPLGLHPNCADCDAIVGDRVAEFSTHPRRPVEADWIEHCERNYETDRYPL